MRREPYKAQLNILVRRRTRDRLRKLAEHLSTDEEKITQTSLLEKMINAEYVRTFNVKA